MFISTVPVTVLPRFAPVKTSRYIVISGETVPTKIDHILTVTMLPQCSPGLVPGSTTVSSRCRLVFPGFTRVKPGSAPVHSGDVSLHLDGVPVTAGHATVLPRSLPVLKMIAAWVNRGGTVVNRTAPGQTGVNRAKFLKPVCPDGIPVHPMESR